MGISPNSSHSTFCYYAVPYLPSPPQGHWRSCMSISASCTFMSELAWGMKTSAESITLAPGLLWTLRHISHCGSCEQMDNMGIWEHVWRKIVGIRGRQSIHWMLFFLFSWHSRWSKLLALGLPLSMNHLLAVHSGAFLTKVVLDTLTYKRHFLYSIYLAKGWIK